MIEEKNKNREINKINIVEKPTEETNPVSEKDVTKNQEINNN